VFVCHEGKHEFLKHSGGVVVNMSGGECKLVKSAYFVSIALMNLSLSLVNESMKRLICTKAL